MPDLLQVDINDRHEARVWLNRPRAHNALNAALIDQLTMALRTLNAQDDVRAVILCATGNTFSAGPDNDELHRRLNAHEDELHADALKLATLLRTLDTLSKPTLARVNGAAYGNAIGLIACCDYAVGTEGAKFALTQVKYGLVPAIIAPYLINAIGPRHARHILIDPTIFDASHAHHIGLLHATTTADELDDVINRHLHFLHKARPQAISQTKQLVQALSPTQHSDEHHAAAATRAYAQQETRDGLQAYLNHRRPPWV